MSVVIPMQGDVSSDSDAGRSLQDCKAKQFWTGAVVRCVFGLGCGRSHVGGAAQLWAI